MRTSILGVAIAAWALAGCGDSPSCESAIRALAKRVGAGEQKIASGITKCTEEKWSGDVRTCVSQAGSMEKAESCLARRAPDDFDSYAKKAKRSEAELNLDAIGKSAKVNYITDAEFPKAQVPLTPATTCCATPSKKCPATASDWQGVDAWDRLDFEMTEDHYFRYSYESDGVTFVARAVGDLDCDGQEVVYELRGEVVDGNPQVTLTKPSTRD